MKRETTTVERRAGKTRRIHFVGVGGIGMSGIAELLANLGYEVTGSDEKRSAMTDRLATLGVTVHDRARGRSMSATPTSSSISSAVRPTNPEVVEARRRGDPGHPARRDARGADAAAVRRSPSLARTARPPRRR